jgi:hypothetical protein
MKGHKLQAEELCHSVRTVKSRRPRRAVIWLLGQRLECPQKFGKKASFKKRRKM